MFLIPILLPSNKKSLLKVFTPEIAVSEPDRLNDDDYFVENEKAKVRTSYVSFKTFADELEVGRSRLLLDRLTPNLGSRPSSFILFSIVPEGSFRDLSLSNERYSNSREASYTSLARLSEIRVDSRANSCARLEPVAEAETSDASVSSEFLDVIIEPPPAEAEFITTPLSCDCIDESTSHVKSVDVNSYHNDKDNVPNIIVSKSTESGFTSEESVASAHAYGTKEFVSSSTSDLDENRLSGYSWNSTGSDLSWKTQCSEANTEDSGYAEEMTPCTMGEKVEDSGHKNSLNTYLSRDNLKSDLPQQSSYCSCDLPLNAKEGNTEFSSFEDEGVELAHSLKEGPLIIDPGPSDYNSELMENQFKDQSQCACGKDNDVSGKLNAKENDVVSSYSLENAHPMKEGPLIIDPGPSGCYIEHVENQLKDESQCACGEDENDFFGKLISDIKETIEQNEPFIADLPQPPDIYSELFEGLLEEVNDYVESFSELSNCYDSLKTWPNVSMTDLKSCERETVV